MGARTGKIRPVRVFSTIMKERSLIMELMKKRLANLVSVQSLVTLVLTVPVNMIIRSLSGFTSIGARLPLLGAVLLVLISMALTLIAGLIPAQIAAKREPVVALRSE